MAVWEHGAWQVVRVRVRLPQSYQGVYRSIWPSACMALHHIASHRCSLSLICMWCQQWPAIITFCYYHTSARLLYCSILFWIPPSLHQHLHPCNVSIEQSYFTNGVNHFNPLNVPHAVQSFYMRDNDDQETVASFDLLVPGAEVLTHCNVWLRLIEVEDWTSISILYNLVWFYSLFYKITLTVCHLLYVPPRGGWTNRWGAEGRTPGQPERENARETNGLGGVWVVLGHTQVKLPAGWSTGMSRGDVISCHVI